MARGKQPGLYITDGGTPYRYNVDKLYYAEGSRGWTDGSANRTHIPSGFKPRHVTGINTTSGRRATAIVADLGAGLFTGVDTTFTIETDDSTTEVQTVVSRIGERPALP